MGIDGQRVTEDSAAIIELLQGKKGTISLDPNSFRFRVLPNIKQSKINTIIYKAKIPPTKKVIIKIQAQSRSIFFNVDWISIGDVSVGVRGFVILQKLQFSNIRPFGWFPGTHWKTKSTVPVICPGSRHSIVYDWKEGWLLCIEKILSQTLG